LTELEEKTERVQRLLATEGLAGLIINAQHNFSWVTGGASNGLDMSREPGAASLLLLATGKRYLLANNIEMPRMLAEEISALDFEPVEYTWQEEKAAANIMIDKATALTGGTVVTDQAVEGRLSLCRYRLTADEVGRYSLLGRDAGHAIAAVIEKIAAGETEIEIAEKMRHELALRGISSVVTLVAADERISGYRHPVPTGKRWERTLLLVTCAKRGGLIASLSRMISIGDPGDELIKKTEAAAYVNACLLDATRKGQDGAGLYQVAARAYETVGFGIEIGRHHQGGAAGYRTREWVAHPESKEVVLEPQGFAWNPSITGTKVEETCLTGAEGVKIITASPGFPQISTTVNGREYLSPGILTV
jgi:Xaa-Pro aminopeptidase